MQQVTQFSNLSAQYIISKLEYYLQKSLYRNQNASSVKLVNKKLKNLLISPFVIPSMYLTE